MNVADWPTLNVVAPEIETERLPPPPPPPPLVDIVTLCVETPGPLEGTVSRSKQLDAQAVEGVKLTDVLALPEVPIRVGVPLFTSSHFASSGCCSVSPSERL